MNGPEQFQFEPRRVDLEIKDPGCEMFSEAQDEVPGGSMVMFVDQKRKEVGRAWERPPPNTGMESKGPWSLLSSLFIAGISSLGKQDGQL